MLRYTLDYTFKSWKLTSIPMKIFTKEWLSSIKMNSQKKNQFKHE